MHDALDFSRHEDTLKCIKPESQQARILTLMLQDVCSCCDFIQSYTKDSEFCMSFSFASSAFVNTFFSGKRTLKNMDGGQDKEIKKLSDVLVERERPSWARLPSLRRLLRFKFWTTSKNNQLYFQTSVGSL